LPKNDALGLIVKGMESLGGTELAGERLTVPYATQDQENEHSCFSDNTHNDIVFDALGIQNLCLGRYQPVDGKTSQQGPGLCDLVKRVNPELGKRLIAELAASVDAARAIPSPFDQAILGPDSAPGRMAIQRMLTALEAQTMTLRQASAALGIGLSVTALHDPDSR
jgi:putative iron-regulated protein